MTAPSLRALVETWASDSDAFHELVVSPLAASRRFGLSTADLYALRRADRLVDPELRRTLRSGVPSPTDSSVTFATGSTITAPPSSSMARA